MSSVKDLADIPTVGKDLIIVAAVDQGLHFRIFDRDGKMSVATDEKKLTEQTRRIEDLKKQLVSLWPPHGPTGIEKAQVIAAVTSIVGHTPGGEPIASPVFLDMILDALVPPIEAVADPEQLHLPRGLFTTLASKAQIDRKSEAEWYTVEVSSCWGSETEWRTRTVEYQKFEIASADRMASDWDRGIAQTSAEMWGPLLHWMQVAFKTMLEGYNQSTNQACTMLNRLFEEQLMRIHTLGEEELRKWRRAQDQVEAVRRWIQALKQVSITEAG